MSYTCNMESKIVVVVIVVAFIAEVIEGRSIMLTCSFLITISMSMDMIAQMAALEVFTRNVKDFDNMVECFYIVNLYRIMNGKIKYYEGITKEIFNKTLVSIVILAMVGRIVFE